MLQDLLAANDDDTLSHYRCLLLGGAAPNPATLSRAVAAEARVYASYGMTETASQIASARVTSSSAGPLTLLPGYEARVVNPDESGAGQLAVRGPGVFPGYLNARTPSTADGFFLTGDTATCERGKLTVFERTGDMFGWRERVPSRNRAQDHARAPGERCLRVRCRRCYLGAQPHRLRGA